MKIVFVAGAPSVGKTMLIKRIIERFHADRKLGFVKLDVSNTDEDEIISREYQIISRKVSSGEMCPDHASVVVLKDVISWAYQSGVEMLFIESAGLCLRCSPYLTHSMGIAVLSANVGINAPLKMGSMIALADAAVVTKVDLVSQAEKEVLKQKLKERYKKVDVYCTNALQGYSLSALYERIAKCEDVTFEEMDNIMLRGNPPLGTCTVCVGRKQIGWDKHYGIVRKITNGVAETMYRGD